MESVKATLTAASMQNRIAGKTPDESYYALIHHCGGAVEMRQSIIDETVAPQHRERLQFEFFAAYQDPINWWVWHSANPEAVRKIIASGSIGQDCVVSVD